MKAKDQFAVMYVQTSKFWDVCDKLGWPDSVREGYQKCSNAVENFGKANFPGKVTITGFHPDENISHYDMDRAIDGKFGKGNADITTDSESGGFYCYVSKPKLKKVLAFIEENFPGFVASTEEDGFKNPFVNWTDAEKYVEEKGLEVPPAFPEELIIKLQEVQAIDDDIKKLEEKKEKLLANIK